MSSGHGTPIWYELMSRDPLAARRFYAEAVGWQSDEELPAGSSMDYRMISAGDGLVGGVFRLTDDVCKQGAVQAPISTPPRRRSTRSKQSEHP
jgi:predicted enzyme related to lactoylglutathione lyase